MCSLSTTPTDHSTLSTINTEAFPNIATTPDISYAQVPMAPPTLLTLPSEIRLLIYQHTIPSSHFFLTLNDEKITYRMRLICRQVKAEYEHEARRLVIRYFDPNAKGNVTDIRWFISHKMIRLLGLERKVGRQAFLRGDRWPKA